jgi:TRAP-type C4-dicarboxylate transport system permease large subunit
LRKADVREEAAVIVLVVEMAQITPPVGFNLFVLQGMTRREITWVARHAFPMFLLITAALFLVYAFPGSVGYLPQHTRSRATSRESPLFEFIEIFSTRIG